MNKLVDKIYLQVSYAIGVSSPLSIYINCYNTNHVSEEELYKIINDNFDFSPSNMIKELDLKKPIYSKTTAYGHFGKENLSYEQFKLIK